MTDAVYDAIAKEYQDSKQLPFRRFAEEPTLLKLLGDIRDLSVLDLACGEGIYARRMKALGAGKIVAVDISSEMIALAKSIENEKKQGIEYLVYDAAKMPKVGEFDLVLASYLLNYADTKDLLLAFCRCIHKNLKPGGRVVGMNDNPANHTENYPLFKPYGFTKSSPVPRHDGDAITYTFHNTDGTSFHFDNFYLSPKHYDDAFREAGFSSFQWRGPFVTAEGIERHGQEYWRLFEKDPPVIGFEARK